MQWVPDAVRRGCIAPQLADSLTRMCVDTAPCIAHLQWLVFVKQTVCPVSTGPPLKSGDMLMGGPCRRYTHFSAFFAVFSVVSSTICIFLVRPSPKKYLISGPIKTGRTVLPKCSWMPCSAVSRQQGQDKHAARQASLLQNLDGTHACKQHPAAILL